MKHSPNVIYIPHGGGPLPLMGDPGHQDLIAFLARLPNTIPTPEAIIMISAHWEENKPTITSNTAPPLIYDYYGFPKQAYEIKYPSPGDPALAEALYDALKNDGFDAVLDQERGFDHGMFVPLKLMYPQANIPCVQLSLIKGLDPKTHIDIGKAIAKLGPRNILVLGSGMSFHNMRAFMSPSTQSSLQSQQFTDWLIETCTSPAINQLTCEQRLINWQAAPSAQYCHPREEHLLPLHVCFGMAMQQGLNAELIYNGKMADKSIVGLRWF